MKCTEADCLATEKEHFRCGQPHTFLCVNCKNRFDAFQRLDSLCYDCGKLKCARSCKCYWPKKNFCIYNKHYIYDLDEIKQYIACKRYNEHPVYKHVHRKCECFIEKEFGEELSEIQNCITEAENRLKLLTENCMADSWK